MEAEELSRLESYYSPGHLDYLLGRIEHVEAENVPGTVREELRARRRVRPGAASLRDALEQLREAESLWERMAGEAAQERPAQLLNLLDSGRALIAQIRALRRGARLRGRPRGPGGGRRRGGSRSPVKGGTAGRTWPRRWPGSRGGGSGDEEEGAAVPQPPSPVLPLETPPGSFCALVQGGRVADGPISLPDGRLSCRQVSQAIGCCLCRDAPSAASEPPHTVPSYSSQVQPYFYFEDEEENCCLLVQHHGNKLQLPALSEGIWKKFELLSEPGFSPSILSIAEQLEMEMVLGSNMFNQSFICDLDDNTSLQSTILQDCMWNGVSIATELQAASQEVNHKELLKEVSLEELLEEVS